PHRRKRLRDPRQPRLCEARELSENRTTIVERRERIAGGKTQCAGSERRRDAPLPEAELEPTVGTGCYLALAGFSNLLDCSRGRRRGILRQTLIQCRRGGSDAQERANRRGTGVQEQRSKTRTLP